MSDFYELTRMLGFPAAALVILAVALWRGMSWTGNKVVLPLVGAHIEYLNASIKAINAISDRLDSQSELLQAIQERANRDEPSRSRRPRP